MSRCHAPVSVSPRSRTLPVANAKNFRWVGHAILHMPSGFAAAPAVGWCWFEGCTHRFSSISTRQCSHGFESFARICGGKVCFLTASMCMQVGRGEDGVMECTPHYSYVCGLKCVLAALSSSPDSWQCAFLPGSLAWVPCSIPHLPPFSSAAVWLETVRCGLISRAWQQCRIGAALAMGVTPRGRAVLQL